MYRDKPNQQKFDVIITHIYKKVYSLIYSIWQDSSLTLVADEHTFLFYCKLWHIYSKRRALDKPAFSRRYSHRYLFCSQQMGSTHAQIALSSTTFNRFSYLWLYSVNRKAFLEKKKNPQNGMKLYALNFIYFNI